MNVKDFFIKIVGWLTIVFVLPNLCLWGIIWWASRKPSRGVSVVSSAKEGHPHDLQECKEIDTTEVLDEENDGQGRRVVFEKQCARRRGCESSEICGFLAEIRYQAGRADFAVFEDMSFIELQYKRDRLSAMIFFLLRGQSTLERQERNLLRDKLKAQKIVLTALIKVYAKEEHLQREAFNRGMTDLLKVQGPTRLALR